jgi:hypothetical protein
VWPFSWRRCSAPPPLGDPPAWMMEEISRRTGKSSEECRRVLDCPTLVEYWELTGDGPDDGEERDPAEFDPTLAPYLLRATLEAEREVGPSGDDGYCFVFWDRKKRILRRRYGIRWRDPSDMNPGNDYD